MSHTIQAELEDLRTKLSEANHNEQVINESFIYTVKQCDEMLVELEELSNELIELSQDATRYRWLRQQFCGVDFDWGVDEGDGKQVLMFSWPAGLPVGANCDKNVDLGIANTKGEP